MDKALLVVARSARALAAAAAAAGYAPWVIDLFGDDDARALATRCWVARARRGWRFEPTALRALVADVVAARDGIALPVIVGSGFERDHALLGTLAPLGPVLGNPAATLAALANPLAVGRRLARHGAVHLPPTRAGAPGGDHAQWLLKRAASSGGAHVRVAAGRRAQRGDYWQRRVPGPVLSALGLAAGGEVTVCGIARHVAPAGRGAAGDFRYHGAIAVATLPAWHVRLAATAAALASEFELRGAFGFDFVLASGDTPVVIDINPRLTASLDVYADRGDILAAHVAACSTNVLAYSRPPSRRPRGHLVVYSARAWQVPPEFAWPPCAADRTPAGRRVGSGDPLVTLVVEGDDEAAVEAGLVTAYDELHRRSAAHGDAVIAPRLSLETVGGFP